MSLTHCFFDLDGTLVENVEHVIDAYLESLDALCLPLTTRSHLRNIQGLSFETTAEAIGVPEHLLADFSDIFWEKMATFTTPPLVLPGVMELLNHLKQSNISCSIVTNNRSYIAANACKIAGLDSFFDYYLGSDLVEPKPNPEGICALCKKYDIDPSEKVLFVGDSVSDLGAAMNAKVQGICVVEEKDFKVRFTDDVMEDFERHNFKFEHFVDCFELTNYLKNLN
ncbi:hypothetical protein GEMRC1_004427 [Eukaryota sp. GEM-RC1]